MKPDELRLKNLILATWSNEVVEVEEIQYMDDNSPLKKELGEYAINQVAIDQYKPIELSEEWLKKAGFTYYRIDGKASLNDDTDQNTGETEYWENNKDLTIVRWDKGDFILSNAFSFSLRPVLKYVHQLQNVVHALTGNELIFNHG